MAIPVWLEHTLIVAGFLFMLSFLAFALAAIEKFPDHIKWLSLEKLKGQGKREDFQ